MKQMKQMKQMKRVLTIITITVVATGCTNRHATMVQQESGTRVDCSAHGWGWYGAPAAARSYNKCVREFGAQGWVQEGIEGVDRTFPPHVDGNDWTVRRAKYALRDTTIDRAQYDRIITHIRTLYDINVRTIKLEYRSRQITKARYEQKVREALYAYKG